MAVTLPSIYYLMQPQIERIQHPEKHGHGGHGGHDGHDEHEEHGEEDEGGEEGGSSEGGESGEEKSEDQGEGNEDESKAGETDEGTSDDSSSAGGHKDTSDTSDEESPGNTTHEKEGGSDVGGVQFKGTTSGGTREGEQGDTRKHIPDAKGFNKKRIESDYGGKEGEAQKPEQDPSDKDMVSNAQHVAPLKMAISLTLDIRLLHPSLQETWPLNQESRKDFQTLILNTPPTLPITLTRVPKVKAALRLPKVKEQWILKDHRPETLDSTSCTRLGAVFADRFLEGCEQRSKRSVFLPQ